MKSIFHLLRFLTPSLIFLLPVFTLAIIGCNPAVEICNPIQSSTFADLMAKIADIAAKIGLPLVVVFMIYAGFLFVSARGDEEQLKKAKTTFFWAVIGALLVVGAVAISLAIENFASQL